MTNVAYMLLLLGFVALGMFVYSLAVGSAAAWIFAAAAVAVYAASIVGFRVGARSTASSNHSGIEIDGANIWARPLRREQIDRYLQSYRLAGDGHQQLPHAVATITGAPSMDRRAA